MTAINRAVNLKYFDVRYLHYSKFLILYYKKTTGWLTTQTKQENKMME